MILNTNLEERDFTEEDKLFTDNIPRFKRMLKTISYEDRFAVIDDLIQDSFILYRRALVNKKWYVDKTISKYMLLGYIFSIMRRRVFMYRINQPPRYYEHQYYNKFTEQGLDIDDVIRMKYKVDYSYTQHSNMDVKNFKKNVLNELQENHKLPAKLIMEGMIKLDITRKHGVTTGVVDLVAKKLKNKSKKYFE